MSIPTFPEANHPIVKSLSHYSDQELLTLFQRYPDSGQYFTAIFCRYSPMVYSLVGHTGRSPIQTDYLFALTWRHIFHELGGFSLQTSGHASLQSWLLQVSAICSNQIELPSVEAIHYNLRAASPPFWCYLDRALDQLPPAMRLMVLMAQAFRWSETRISAYLQAEGEMIAPIEVRARLKEGYQLLEEILPEDIQSIYLTGNAKEQEGIAVTTAS